MAVSTSPSGVFITGTDTEIGKTFVSCALALGFRQQGIAVIPRKPIASGCEIQQGQLLATDALQLQQACHSDEPLSQICPYQFAQAISPARAIAQSEQTIRLADLYQACLVKKPGLVLVEGAGGFLSPLAADGLNADLAQKLNYPVILVVGNRLGCLNHALLTIEAIEARNLTIKAVVLNDLSADSDPDNLSDLKQLTTYPVFHQPYQSTPSALILD